MIHTELGNYDESARGVMLVRGVKILTMDPQRPVITDGAVLVEGESIKAIGDYKQLRQDAEGIPEIGEESTWVLPGFFNGHYHSGRNFSMGVATDPPLELLVQYFAAMEFPEDIDADEFLYLNTLVSALQLVRSGVTATVDMNNGDVHKPVIQAYLDLGLDLVFAPVARTQLGYVYADDEEFLASLPDDLRRKVDGKGFGQTGGYQSPEEYWQDWQDLKTCYGDRIQLVISPDGPQWCSECTIAKRPWKCSGDSRGLARHRPGTSPISDFWGPMFHLGTESGLTMMISRTL